MTTAELDPITRLTRDLARASATLSTDEARYLVDSYYQVQDYRKAARNQKSALVESEEPHATIDWYGDQMEAMESQLRRALAAWADGQPVGVWAQTITGIGPVIAAGLLAHIDITRCPTVGHLWRFAGLDPTTTWEKGQKRPWNADLKVLCWKIGESFVKVQGSDSDVYGKVYAVRKAYEQERNERGDYADQAASTLERKRIGKDTEAYKAYSIGKLPPAHIHARAKRYAVKLFLAHWHHVAYEVEFGEPPPKPYVIEHLGHVHYIAPPNWPMQA